MRLVNRHAKNTASPRTPKQWHTSTCQAGPPRLSDAAEPPAWREGLFNSVDQIPREPRVGWLALSVSLLNRGVATRELDHARFSGREPFLNWLSEREPVALVGTSILVYRLTPADILNWNTTAESARGDWK